MTFPRIRSFTSLGTLPFVAAILSAACSSSSTPSTPGNDAGTPHDAFASHDTGHDAHTAPKVDAGHDTGVASKKDTGAPQDSGSDVALDAGGPSDAGGIPVAAGDATTAKAAITFAFHHLYLGDSLANSSFTPGVGTAWSTFGYNIDGLITNENSTDVCTLTGGAAKANQVDGDNGIDNSFGETIVPFLVNAGLTNLSQNVSGSLTSGAFTLLLDTTGLTSSPTQTSTGLTGGLLSGASYGGTPPTNDAGSFLTTDDWPVTSSSLGGSLDAGAVISFPSAYVSNGTWVNGTPSDITLQLALQGQPLVLKIHHAIVTFNHTVDASGQDHATLGLISGVLKTSEFLVEIDEVAAEQDYCTEAALLLNFIQSTSDIMQDGTNGPGQPCDGISIGLAFDADGIAQPDKVIQSVDAGGLPTPCVVDAGG